VTLLTVPIVLGAVGCSRGIAGTPVAAPVPPLLATTCRDYAGMAPEARRKLADQHPPAEHPVVRTHPETGEKVLNVCSFTTHFVNFHTPENVRFGIDKMPGAAHLLSYLQSQASIPEYQVRFQWQPNSVAIWDNRSTQHYAVMDYWPAPRKMERAGIIGDRPY
jgi:taurine dioxygenase